MSTRSRFRLAIFRIANKNSLHLNSHSVWGNDVAIGPTYAPVLRNAKQFRYQPFSEETL